MRDQTLFTGHKGVIVCCEKLMSTMIILHEKLFTKFLSERVYYEKGAGGVNYPIPKKEFTTLEGN